MDFLHKGPDLLVYELRTTVFCSDRESRCFRLQCNMPNVMQTAVIIGSKACEVDAALNDTVHRAEREGERERESTVTCLTADLVTGCSRDETMPCAPVCRASEAAP